MSKCIVFALYLCDMGVDYFSLVNNSKNTLEQNVVYQVVVLRDNFFVDKQHVSYDTLYVCVTVCPYAYCYHKIFSIRGCFISCISFPVTRWSQWISRFPGFHVQKFSASMLSWSNETHL